MGHNEPMSKGPVVTAVVAGLAMVGAVYAFLANASPYVTIPQAMSADAQGVHVVGAVDRNTIHNDIANHALLFDLTDTKGHRMSVCYTGVIPQDFSDAPQVVVIGGMSHDKFLATDMQVKCPSKYDSKSSQSGSGTRS